METESDGSERERSGSLRFRDRVEDDGWHVGTGVSGAARFCRGRGDDPERRRWRSHVPMADGVRPAWNPALRCTHVIGSGGWANRERVGIPVGGYRFVLSFYEAQCMHCNETQCCEIDGAATVIQPNERHLPLLLARSQGDDGFVPGRTEGFWERSGYHRLDGSQLNVTTPK
ncbi:unnamed protein product [Musa hybrid cultivar]